MAPPPRTPPSPETSKHCRENAETPVPAKAAQARRAEGKREEKGRGACWELGHQSGRPGHTCRPSGHGGGARGRATRGPPASNRAPWADRVWGCPALGEQRLLGKAQEAKSVFSSGTPGGAGSRP